MNIHEAIHLVRSGRFKWMYWGGDPQTLYNFDEHSKSFSRWFRFNNGTITLVDFRIYNLKLVKTKDQIFDWEVFNQGFHDITGVMRGTDVWQDI